MQRRWQHHGWLILAALMFGACAEDTGKDESTEKTEEESVSGISFALRSVDSQGRSYRLRNATFTVTGDYWYYDGGAPPESTVLSTEDDPDAERLSVRLVPGPYRVELGGDWYLERLGPDGAERVEKVVLLTEAVQWAYVYDGGWNYDLDFRFGVDGDLIDFRNGELGIGISIELPGDSNYQDAGMPWPWPFPPGVILDGGVLVP